jgi:hypothetical protein
MKRPDLTRIRKSEWSDRTSATSQGRLAKLLAGRRRLERLRILRLREQLEEIWRQDTPLPLHRVGRDQPCHCVRTYIRSLHDLSRKIHAAQTVDSRRFDPDALLAAFGIGIL